MLQIQGKTAWIGHSVTLHNTPRSPDPTLHTQEVRSSSLRAPTIVFNDLQDSHLADISLCPLCVRNLGVAQHRLRASSPDLSSAA